MKSMNNNYWCYFSLNSALLVSLLLGRSLEDSIDLALQAVAYTLASTDAIAEELSELNIAAIPCKSL